MRLAVVSLADANVADPTAGDASRGSGRRSVHAREARLVAGNQVQGRVRVEGVQQGLRAPDLEPVRCEVVADSGPERGGAHPGARVVEEVAALDVDVLVVA